MRRKSLEDVMAQRVDVAGVDQCWEWKGAINSRGYGSLMNKNRQLTAHRVAYEMAYGPIASGLIVMHKCDNRKCCNPMHLLLGTIGDNNRDRHTKGRSRGGSMKGVTNPSAKLTEQQVIEIYNSSGTLQSIADKFGLKMQSIHDIKTGRNWGWLTGTNRRAGNDFR